FEIVAMEFIDYSEITRLLDTLVEVADADPMVVDPLDSPLAGVADLVTAELVTPDLLVKIADNESIIVYRMVTDAVKGTGISVPLSAYQVHAYAGDDLTKDELINLAHALEAFGLNSLELDTFDTGSFNIALVGDALGEGSLIVNRMISKVITDMGLATAESHEGTEDPFIDVQIDEMENLVVAFQALGIDTINGAGSVNFADLISAAQAIPEAEFNIYIDYMEPYDPLTEDLGLTIVKDFLISKLDNQIPVDIFDPFGPKKPVTNRQELHDVIYE